MVRYRRLLLLPVDLALVAFSVLLAYLIRFDGAVPAAQWDNLVLSTIIGCVVLPVFFVGSGFYRRLWRYASVPDLVHIGRAVTLGSLTATALLFLVGPDPGYPRSIPVLGWLILTALIMGRSLVWRLVQEYGYTRRLAQGQPVLVVGAGMAGRMLFQEIRNNRGMDYTVVGFLDDDPGKIGGTVNGSPVLGSIAQLPVVAKHHGVKRVIIAIPSAPAKLVRRVVRACQEAGIEVQTLPAIRDMLSGALLAAQLRKVNLEDLLRRDAVQLETERVQMFVTGRRVLVTGAGGSIGSELCRQMARFGPREITLLDVAETPLHDIQLELERAFPTQRIYPVLADIRDPAQLKAVFGEREPQVVFHAAAYKHVPMMEWHPLEAIKTNILGTRNLAEAAVGAGVERFVMISTDKAVNPTNVMGASKRVAEMCVQAMNGVGHTEFVTVRFGNVLGSNGSVVPLFQEQIRRGGPITVTHPDVTRYFMTIPEAAQLVLQAGSMGRGGEIFLLDMGEPVRIVDLAEDLIRLSGLQPYEDVEIQFTGLRPGEKLFEELLVEGEGVKPTTHHKVCVAGATPRRLSEVQRDLREFEFCVQKGDPALSVEKLQQVVPEFRPLNRSKGGNVRLHPLAGGGSFAILKAAGG